MSSYLHGCDETILGAMAANSLVTAPRPIVRPAIVVPRPAPAALPLLTRGLPPPPVLSPAGLKALTAATAPTSPTKPAAVANAASAAATAQQVSAAASKATAASSAMDSSVSRLVAAAGRNRKLGPKVSAIASTLSKKSSSARTKASAAAAAAAAHRAM